VDAETDFTITGRLASFGRGGMIKDISNRLLSQFSDCLQQRLSGEPEPAATTVAAGGMTAEDAAASAGAETRPEESAAAAPGAGATTGASASGGDAPPTTPPPAQAEPLQAGSLVLGVLQDRAKALGATIVRQVKALAPVVVERVKTLLGRARARRSG
jgi:hypothetical protein